MRGLGFAVLAVLGVANAQTGAPGSSGYPPPNQRDRELFGFSNDDDQMGDDGLMGSCEQVCLSYYGAQLPFDWGYNANNDLYTIEADLQIAQTVNCMCTACSLLPGYNSYMQSWTAAYSAGACGVASTEVAQYYYYNYDDAWVAVDDAYYYDDGNDWWWYGDDDGGGDYYYYYYYDDGMDLFGPCPGKQSDLNTCIMVSILDSDDPMALLGDDYTNFDPSSFCGLFQPIVDCYMENDCMYGDMQQGCLAMKTMGAPDEGIPQCPELDCGTGKEEDLCDFTSTTTCMMSSLDSMTLAVMMGMMEDPDGSATCKMLSAGIECGADYGCGPDSLVPAAALGIDGGRPLVKLGDWCEFTESQIELMGGECDVQCSVEEEDTGPQHWVIPVVVAVVFTLVFVGLVVLVTHLCRKGKVPRVQANVEVNLPRVQANLEVNLAAKPQASPGDDTYKPPGANYRNMV